MTEESIIRELQVEHAFGNEVKAFLQSNIGRYLISRAEAERAEALEALANADPDNGKTIRTLQTSIRVVDHIQRWLAEAISEGSEAARLLEDQG